MSSPPFLSAVHPDIIKTHILSRLDGTSLASAACASSDLHALITSNDNLWRDACASTWPSTADPRFRNLISSHRSFFSDSFPLVKSSTRLKSQTCNNIRRPKLLCKLVNRYISTPSTPPSPSPPGPIISAVDIFHHDELVFSKVHVTDASAGLLSTCSPFRVTLACRDRDGTVPVIPTRRGSDEDEEDEELLVEGLTLSWIVIDPTRKRAANVSSHSPVSVHRQWPGGDVVEVSFGTTIGAGRCHVAVTCGGKEGGEIVGVSMHVEGADGRVLNGRDSLVILQDAVENGERVMRRPGQDGKRMFEEYEESRTRRTRRVQRIERLLDLAYVATCLTLILAFCCFIFLR